MINSKILKIGAFVMGAILGQVAGAADWSRPGANRYALPVAKAVQHYTDIPAATRDRLEGQIEHRAHSDTVAITRDKITGTAGEYTGLRDMHWGKRARPVLGAVTRQGWVAGDMQRAWVYCADGYCVAVPWVCGNVARIDPPPKKDLSERAVIAAAPVATVNVEDPQVMAIDETQTFASAATPEKEYVYITDYRNLYASNFIYLTTYVPIEVNIPTEPPITPVAPPVPEPETWLLMSAGILGLFFKLRRKNGN